MPRSFSDVSTGWSFEAITDASGTRPPPGGLILKNIRHQQHNFAKDLRLVGIRLLVYDVDTSGAKSNRRSIFFPLSDPFFTVSTIQEFRPVATTTPNPRTGSVFHYLRETNEALLFQSYFRDATGNHAGYAIRADYTMNATTFTSNWPNCEYSQLIINQIFLFSHYGNLPRHEPSGGLHAARCHPLTKFEFTANPSLDRSRTYQRIESIRFDYRIHLYLDRFQGFSSQSPTSQLGNNAGLFRDNDTVALGSAILGTLGNLSTAAGFSAAAFAAVEKPVVLEVVAPGLVNGFSGYNDGQRNVLCWDNIHWWGTRGPGYPLISAPGAFHAAHIHWRWGAAGSALRGTIPEIDTSGTPAAVRSHPLVGSLATRTLVDPRIWAQTIRIAVVKNEPGLDPNRSGVSLYSLSADDWKTTFTSLRASPEDIYNGGDIVLWKSVEVPREITISSFSRFTPPNYTSLPATTYQNDPVGTVFIHGIFFAHNPEIRGLMVGSTDPAHWPNSISSIRRARRWFRSA